MDGLQGWVQRVVMKRSAARFLRVVIVLIALAAVFAAIRFPLIEGRAANLDLFSIYADPFILYGYASSIAFFVALFKAYQLMGYIGRNKMVSWESIRVLKTIQYCAVVLAMLIALAGLYIKLFHHQDDDPAGFLAMCTVITLLCVVVAVVAAKFGKALQKQL